MRRRRLIAAALRRIPLLRVALRLAIRLLIARRRVGVVAVLLDDRGQVLLARHVARLGRPWGLPGGWLAAREAPETGLARELREELGVEARVERLLLAEILEPHDSGGLEGLTLAYSCTIEGGAPASFEPGALAWELLEARWFAPDDDCPPVSAVERRAIRAALGDGHESAPADG